jgi:hypothetical protein
MLMKRYRRVCSLKMLMKRCGRVCSLNLESKLEDLEDYKLHVQRQVAIRSFCAPLALQLLRDTRGLSYEGVRHRLKRICKTQASVALSSAENPEGIIQESIIESRLY